MIVRSSEIRPVNRENVAGGEGKIQSAYAMAPGTGPNDSAFRMIATMTMTPGSSVGGHVHSEDEEVYVILSGSGVYVDADGSRSPVGPGDVTLTFRGQSHALINTGKDPLVFLAMVVK